MNSSEKPEQNSSETPEERQERLKRLAKARVERLVADDVVRPHLDSSGKRDLVEAANVSGPVKSSTERLIEDGFLELPIRSHNVRVTKAQHNALPTGEVMFFTVEVDGIVLGDPLVCSKTRESTSFSIKTPKNYTNMLHFDEIRNTYPLAVLRGLIDNDWFASYLYSVVAAKRIIALRVEETSQRVMEETDRFRDVLLRKFKQLTYIDEYETLEAARFKDELQRFVAKRLHDLQDIPHQLWSI
jgi:restriction system protein